MIDEVLCCLLIGFLLLGVEILLLEDYFFGEYLVENESGFVLVMKF